MRATVLNVTVPNVGGSRSSSSRGAKLVPCDISRHRVGGTDIPYVTTRIARRPGPHVLINALTHGNELCGALAVDRLVSSGLAPARGTLSLSFANVTAYERFDSTRPFASRFVDEDLNRLWSPAALATRRRSVELDRARALSPLVDRVDCLLDIHSTAFPAPPLLLCGRHAKGQALARAMGSPAHVVADAGHAAGPRLRDYGGFDDALDPKCAMLVECGQHFEPESFAVALDSCMRFLLACGTIDTPPSALSLPEPTEPQHLVQVTDTVTITSERFAFVRPVTCFQVIPKAGTLIARDGNVPVRTPYDDCVLVLPARQPMPGQTAVRLGRRAPWADA